jgi:hypothetical protein
VPKRSRKPLVSYHGVNHRCNGPNRHPARASRLPGSDPFVKFTQITGAVLPFCAYNYLGATNLLARAAMASTMVYRPTQSTGYFAREAH